MLEFKLTAHHTGLTHRDDCATLERLHGIRAGTIPVPR